MINAPTRPSSTRSRWLPAVIVAIVALGVGAAAVLGALGSSTPAATAAPLELNLGDGGAMASCLAFDVAFLAEMPVAFEGTVASAGNDRISVTVDRWYRGGDAPVVELTAPQGLEALIGGIEFHEGHQYLITATDGNVNYCGFSGPATPELRASFEQVFGR